jgi:hypothetical protein
VDSMEIIRTARRRGQRPETYDPSQLVADVRMLLRERGLHPDASGHGGMAAGAAGMLLRAFGILPACDERAIDRLNAPDPEER